MSHIPPENKARKGRTRRDILRIFCGVLMAAETAADYLS